VENRALIRFGEETNVSNVGPSMSAGILLFESMAPGSGSCYLTCHGTDHAGVGYGAGETGELQLIDPLLGLESGFRPGAALPPSQPTKPPRKKKIPPRKDGE
jgi:hypothetical protein